MKLATATVIAIIDLCRARGGKFDGTIVIDWPGRPAAARMATIPRQKCLP